MKKLFILAAAIVAFASCSQNEPEATVVPTREIKFATAAQTRASAAIVETETTLQTNGFSVWGYMMTAPQATIFEKVDVKYASNVWEPEEAADVKYWSAGNDYWFSAMAPKNLENIYSFATTGTEHTQSISEFTIAADNSTPDLIVAKPVLVQIGDQETVHNPVALTFDHMLSRVKFTFTNAFADDNVTIKVSKVTLNGVVAKGSASIANGVATWTKKGEETLNVNFYDANNATEVLVNVAQTDAAVDSAGTVYRYIIPQPAATYSVSFHLEIMADNQTIATKDYENIALPSTTFENGKGHVFNANIVEEIIEDELYPIQFNVTVTDWEDKDPVNITFN